MAHVSCTTQETQCGSPFWVGTKEHGPLPQIDPEHFVRPQGWVRYADHVFIQTRGNDEKNLFGFGKTPSITLSLLSQPLHKNKTNSSGKPGTETLPICETFPQLNNQLRASKQQIATCQCRKPLHWLNTKFQVSLFQQPTSLHVPDLGEHDRHTSAINLALSVKQRTQLARRPLPHNKLQLFHPHSCLFKCA